MNYGLDHVLFGFCAFAISAALTRRWPTSIFVLVPLVAAALFIRWPVFSAAEILVAAVGTLSIPSLLFAAQAALGRTEAFVSSSPVIGAIGLILYVSCFGFTMLDIYAYGFSAWVYPCVALPLLVVSSVRGDTVHATILAAVTAAWGLELYPSRNWWDYGLDPCLWAMAVVVTIVKGVQSSQVMWSNKPGAAYRE